MPTKCLRVDEAVLLKNRGIVCRRLTRSDSVVSVDDSIASSPGLPAWALAMAFSSASCALIACGGKQMRRILVKFLPRPTT